MFLILLFLLCLSQDAHNRNSSIAAVPVSAGEKDDRLRIFKERQAAGGELTLARSFALRDLSLLRGSCRSFNCGDCHLLCGFPLQVARPDASNRLICAA